MNEKNTLKFLQSFKMINSIFINEIKALIQEEIIDARGIENAKFYDVLRKLSDSENNAGWEDRHSERISTINKSMGDMVDDYNEYLP